MTGIGPVAVRQPRVYAIVGNASWLKVAESSQLFPSSPTCGSRLSSARASVMEGCRRRRSFSGKGKKVSFDFDPVIWRIASASSRVVSAPLYYV